ncbi:hypothetical protein [Anaeromyxobacter terrae]|uniref:hypothetical protein n=1 Tax=Anaeromyxobacter terrae TaxID=2925406 RepID=UPI001F57B2E1|nr:hypothetical protein [Anaeromyxobacter sp. SG22]
MTAYDFPGLVGGMAGVWLFLFGVVLAAGAGLRIAWVRRRPGKGRVARGLLSAGVSFVLSGIALFWAAERSALRRELDRGAPWLAVFIVGVAVLAAVRSARRRARDEAAAPGEPEL